MSCDATVMTEAFTTEFILTFTSASSTEIGQYSARPLSYLLWRRHFWCVWVEPWTDTFV